MEKGSVDRETSPRLQSTRERVTESIRDRLNKLTPLYSQHCIPRVPERLRNPNPQAFTPRLISIGPLHSHQPNLKPIEDLKLRFLKSFFARADKALAIIDFVVRKEAAIRRHYDCEILLDSKDFSEMMLLDSVFILELLLKKQEISDPIFQKRWLCRDLMHDMILIENQIPMFVPRKIYNKFMDPAEGKKPFQHLVRDYIKEVGNVPEFLSQREPSHFIEYLTMAHLPKTEMGKGDLDSVVHSVTDVLQFGVELAQNMDSPLLEICFENGVLKIPHLTVNEWTATLFHNLVAFEQWQGNFCISDYVIFMCNILQTPKDVEILTGKGIIEDTLNDSEKVCNMFKEFYRDLPTKGRHFYFAQVCEKLNEYVSTKRRSLLKAQSCPVCTKQRFLLKAQSCPILLATEPT